MKKILPIVVVAIVALGAGYFLFAGGGGEENQDKAAAESSAEGGHGTTDAAAEEAEEKKEYGKVTDIEAITLNLADGRFLKIGISLQASHAAGEEKLPKGPALDKVIEVFSTKTVPELMDPAVREHIHDQLNEEIREIYTKEEGKPEVLKIYFTEFVMQ